jgi:hypothetical protein
MDYIIVIPSYNRPHALKTHTLRVLEEGLIPIEIIHIFVADVTEYEIYKKVLGNDYKIIIGVPGLRNQRNYISAYFPLQTKIVSIDDDIQDFYIKHNITGKLEIINDLNDIFKTGFITCNMNKSNLFGFYPCLNNLFMKNNVTTDLRFIVGSCYGYINTRTIITVLQKQDYENTLLHYLRDHVVVRFNYISMKTKYYKMKGGLQSFQDRMEQQNISVNYLLTSYPEYIKRKKSYNSGYPEIRLLNK